MNRRDFVMLAATTAVIAPKGSSGAEPIPVTLYKNPECSCCESYAHYLGENGFKVDERSTNDLAEISRKAGVPENLEGCHTSFIGDYVVGGHVPVPTIRKLLGQKPAIAGITLPGMPPGSPGMGGEKTGSLIVYSVSGDSAPPRVFDVV